MRTVVLYLVLIFAVRMMGKRQIGQMEPSEFVVTMLVANLAAIPMQDEGVPLHAGLLPILVVLGMELSLSGVIMRSVKLRKFLCHHRFVRSHGKRRNRRAHSRCRGLFYLSYGRRNSERRTTFICAPFSICK